MEIGARAQQLLHDRRVVVSDREEQRRAALGVPHVHILADRQEVLCRLQVAVPGQ